MGGGFHGCSLLLHVSLALPAWVPSPLPSWFQLDYLRLETGIVAMMIGVKFIFSHSGDKDASLQTQK